MGLFALGTGVALSALQCVTAAPGDEAVESDRFVQRDFVISMWVDPPVDERADERYKEMADAYFNLVIGGFGAHTPEEVEKQLEVCHKHGLGLLVRPTGDDAADYPDGPACWGYSLRDEPNAAEFPALAEQVAAVRRERPGKLAYINLFPGYASAGALGTETYDEHVRQFVDITDIDVLSMDHYPIFKPDGDGRDAYCTDLAVMREHALRKGIPFWNFFNIMPYGPHTDPTESQVRWQVFTSLAYGAKGVMYFCYYTPGPGGEFPKGGAIIARDDRRTDHYYQARRLNEQLRNLGPTLMKLTSTGVYRVTPEDDPEEALAGSPIVNITRDGVDPPHDYLVGAFQHEDGRRAVLLNNYRFAFTAWPTVTFDVPTEQVLEVDPWTGAERPVIDDSPGMDGLQLSLLDGGGRLFLLPAAAE